MHLPDDIIEVLAVRDDLAAHEPHLRDCPACRERREFVRRLHTAFAESADRPPDPRILRAMEAPASQFEIRLRPFRPQVDVPFLRDEPRIMLLAAKSTTEPLPAEAPAVVYASDTEDVLLRIVTEDPSGVYRLYVLAEDRTKADRVLIGVVSPSGELALSATGDDGSALLESHTPFSWADASVVIFLPLAEIVIPEDLRSGRVLTAGNVRVTVGEGGETTRFTCEVLSGPAPRRALCRRPDGTTDLLEIFDGGFILPSGRRAAGATVRLFP